MKSLLKRIFFLHWPRKLISLAIAIVIWFVVGQSLTSTKTLTGVPVRVTHIPSGMTVEGLQSNGLLNKRVSLVLQGNKTLLEDLSSSDLEVVIDATGHEKEWIEEISRKNITLINPDLNLSGISRVGAKSFIVKMTKIFKEKIPVIISQPVGEPPKGYQYLDIWPYQLYVTVSGPEIEVKKLKARGVKLTFNLSDISKAQLDDLKSAADQTHQDIVSYFVPAHWKSLYLPQISETPIEIDDPDAKLVRIDFVRSELVPIKAPVQVNFFCPLNSSVNPSRIQIGTSPLIENRNGFKMVTKPLFAKGASELFIEIIRNYLEIMVIVGRNPGHQNYEWSVQFINPGVLEDHYVATLMSDMSESDANTLQPQAREEYLRNRFRNYMQNFRLYDEDDKPLSLQIELQGNQIVIVEANANKP